MKKEIKSYEELAKHHLKYFTAIFNGEIIDGTVLVYDDFINLHYKQKNMDGIIHLIHIEPSDVIIKSSISNLCIEVEEEWKPKFGEVVEVSNGKGKWFKRIFIGEYDGVVHCVKEGDESYFKKYTLNGYHVLQWGNIRRYEEPKIEINIEEAKRIIAGNKGVNPENVTIKGL